jgi:hypothetical protein
MEHPQTNRRSRHLHRPFGTTAFLPMAIIPLFGVLAVASLRADTVFLKDGTQIIDCQVTKETDTHVYLRTPVGDMGVPRTEIHRILRVKTAYDKCAEQLASIREGDHNALYKLALWCRATEGLRKESDDLLEKVVSLKEDHAEARRLLCHVKLGGKWVVPEPLSLQLKVSGQNTDDVRKNLDLFLKMRRGVRLAPEPKSRKGSEAEGINPLDACTLDVSVTISRKAASKFYGVAIGQATLGATVRLEARSPWLGKTQVKTAADGLAPGKAGDVSLAVKNALSGGGGSLHRFLDQLIALRLKKIEEEFREKAAEEKKAGKASPPKASKDPATKSG